MKQYSKINFTFIVIFWLLSPFNILAETAKDNTIKLNSDHSEIDGKSGAFKHCGNAILKQQGMTIKAECLIGEKSANGDYRFISAEGNPAELIQTSGDKNESLNLKAKLIKYRVPESLFVVKGKAQLVLLSNNNDRLSIQADEIQLDNKQTQERSIAAKGKPLAIELIKSDVTDLKAEARELKYNTKTHDLVLTTEVQANLALGQISAGLFKYNSETKVSSFEKSDDSQIEIIQTAKEEK